MNKMDRLLVDLADCRDKGLAGGKAVNLGQLIRAGFPVPGGFVVSTEAYRVAHRSGLAAQPALAERIRAAWRGLGGVPVAVRSSATAEDMAEASMAGQYETFLDIADEASLVRAIEACWKSVDTARTRTYLAEQGIALEQVAMAVVVQKLIPAEVAGVLFTANPRTGSRNEMVAEASWGLGEAVVSGRVQPDVLVLDRETGGVVRSVIADKQVCILPGDRQERPVEEQRRNAPCLRSADVESLWRLGQRVAEYFGNPQDVEWAIHDGQVYLLQARPITTLAHAEAYEEILQATRARLRGLREAGRGPWVPHNIGETLKHPTTLTWSVVQRFMSGSGGFGAMYREAGFEPSEKVRTEGFLERIAGRVYMDTAMAPEMFFADYPFRYDLETLRSSPDAGQAPPTTPAGSFAERMKALKRVGEANARLRSMSADLDRRLNEQIVPQFVAWCREEKNRDLAKLRVPQLIELWQQREARVMNEFGPKSLLPSLVLAMALGELRALLDESFWDEDPDELATLLSASGEADKTVQANAQLYEVATGQRSVEAWLEEHGHRAPDEFDLATPRWREQPEELLAIASRLKDGADPMELHRRRLAESEHKRAELRAQLDEEDARLFDERVALVHRYIAFREDSKHYLMLGYDLLRDVAVEAGRRLELGAEVFHLTLEELFDALRVGYAPRHLVAQRKQAYEAEARISLPMVIDGEAIERLGEPVELSVAGSHAGFAVSTGVASGPARIVRSPQEAGELGKGYVLVCPSTDPGWTALFVNAAGLVLECGGTLSHGAVIAREMSIPAVVLPGATDLFHDGETVTVDGRNGRVVRGEASGSISEPGGDDVRIPRELVPPARGKRERWSANVRNISLVVWGIYLAAAYLLPEAWIYRPTMAVFDALLWPVVRGLGKPAAVVMVAVAMAVATMVGQKLLTDNRRLRVAKRRADELTRQALRLPRGSRRRNAMLDLAEPVQMRVALASLVPLAVLLGPMMMSFAWLPLRVDPAAVNAPADALVSVVATVDSGVRTPVTLEVTPPLRLENPEQAAQTLPPIREALERIYAQRQQPSDLSNVSWEVRSAALRAREEELTDLQAFLKQGVPPQKLSWQLRCSAAEGGRFPVVVKTRGAAPLRGEVVLGPHDAPGLTTFSGSSKSPLISMEVVYPKAPVKLAFWTIPGIGWDPGWLVTYLLAYLPVMFGLRWALRLA